LAVAAIVALSPLTGAAQGGAALVGVDEVRAEVVSQTFPVVGRLVARRAGVIAARVGGPVAEIKVEIGDRVQKGQVIAVLVRERLRWERERRAADLAEQQAKLRGSEAEMQLKQQELQRLERLQSSRSAAFRQALFDDTQIELAVLSGEMAEARARLNRAEADLRLAELSLDYAVIRAPFQGVVTLRHTEVGAFLSAGASVVTIVDDGALEIEADVPVKRIAGLRAGDRVELAIGERIQTGLVRAVVPEENPLTRTRAVRFTPEFATQNAGFAANQSVTVQIPISRERDVVSVHKDAVLARGEGRMVFVVKEGAAQPRPVRVGDAVGERFIVEQGLTVGELVVVRGNERLFPGQPVRF